MSADPDPDEEAMKMLQKEHVPPPKVVDMITKIFPKFKEKLESVRKKIYAGFVKEIIKEWNHDSLAFVIDLNNARVEYAKTDHGTCTADLKAIFEKFVKRGAPLLVNLGPYANELRKAAPTDPNAAVWREAEGWIFRNYLLTTFRRYTYAAENQKYLAKVFPPKEITKKRVKLRRTQSMGDISKGKPLRIGGAHAAYHNEGYYNYDSVDNSELSYLSNGGRAYSMRDSVRGGGYIGVGGPEYLDPSLAVIGFLIATFMCLVCIGFTAIASCAVGYWTRWFKEDLLSEKERDRNGVFVEEV